MSGMSKQCIALERMLIAMHRAKRPGEHDYSMALTSWERCLDEIERLQKLCEVTLKDYCERAEK